MSSLLTLEDIFGLSSHYSLRMQPYAVRMHFMHLFWELDLFSPFSF